MSDKKHLYWVRGLVLITIVLCGTLIWLNYNSWTLRFEMDNNTLEAVKGINWSEALNNQDVVYKCYVVNKVTTKYWDIANNVFVGKNSYIENSTEINCKELNENN